MYIKELYADSYAKQAIQFVSSLFKDYIVEIPEPSIEIRLSQPPPPRACPLKKNPDFTADYTVLITSNSPFHVQLTYQYAHELLHVAMKCLPENAKFQWISEIMCDAASLYALKQAHTDSIMQSLFLTPYNNEYLDYYKNVINKCKACWPIGVSTEDFCKRNLYCFEHDGNGPFTLDNSYRWRNTIIADEILKVIETNPAPFDAVSFMNDFVTPDSDSKTFLKEWANIAPNPLLPNVILSLFGF